MATIYYNNTRSGSWDNSANWFTDNPNDGSAPVTTYGQVPQDGDTVYCSIYYDANWDNSTITMSNSYTFTTLTSYIGDPVNGCGEGIAPISYLWWTNYGTISGGTFTGSGWNNDGTISGGTFTNAASCTFGTVTGGYWWASGSMIITDSNNNEYVLVASGTNPGFVSVINTSKSIVSGKFKNCKTGKCSFAGGL